MRKWSQRRGQRKREVYIQGCYIAGFEDEGRGHEPRKSGDL